MRYAGIFVSIGLVLSAGISVASEVPRTYVVFRMDDYSQKSEWETEKRVIELFHSRSLPICVAAIPFEAERPLAGERAEYLRRMVEAGIVEPALHGRTHADTSDPGVSPSELRGLSYDTQLGQLQQAKFHLQQEVLSGHPLRIFVPPFNTYDETTISVLEELGFEVLSARCDGPVPEDSELSYVPFTALLHEVQEAVRVARSTGRAAAIVVLLHDYEFTDRSPRQDALYGATASFTFSQLRGLLDWLMVQPDVEVTSLTGLLGCPIQFDARAFAREVGRRAQYLKQHRGYFMLRRRLTPTWAARPLRDPIGHSLVYPLPDEHPGTLAILGVFLPAIACYSVALLGGMVFGLAARRLRCTPSAAMAWWGLAVGAAGLVAIWALALAVSAIGYKIVATAAFCCGFLGVAAGCALRPADAMGVFHARRQTSP